MCLYSRLSNFCHIEYDFRKHTSLVLVGFSPSLLSEQSKVPTVFKKIHMAANWIRIEKMNACVFPSFSVILLTLLQKSSCCLLIRKGNSNGIELGVHGG